MALKQIVETKSGTVVRCQVGKYQRTNVYDFPQMTARDDLDQEVLDIGGGLLVLCIRAVSPSATRSTMTSSTSPRGGTRSGGARVTRITLSGCGR